MRAMNSSQGCVLASSYGMALRASLLLHRYLVRFDFYGQIPINYGRSVCLPHFGIVTEYLCDRSVQVLSRACLVGSIPKMNIFSTEESCNNFQLPLTCE